MSNAAAGAPVLTIIQPWLWAIEHLGKRIENRTWPTNRRGSVLLQAGMKYDSLAQRKIRIACKDRAVDFPPDAHATLPRGVIALRVQLVGCFKHTRSVRTYQDVRDRAGELREIPPEQRFWIFNGSYCHVFADVTPVQYVPLRGMPGYFHPQPAPRIKEIK